MHFVLIFLLFVIYIITGTNRSDVDKTVRKRQVIWMGFSLFLFAALRSYTVGGDVVRYYEGFNEAVGMQPEEVLFYFSTRDPVFHIINHYLGLWFHSPRVMLVYVGAIVAFGFSFFTYHQKGNVLLFYILFLGFRMFPFTLSGLRQGVALGLIFIAGSYLIQKNTFKSFLFTILAALFHKTAILFILAYPVMKWKNDKLFVAAIIGFAFFNIVTNNALASILATFAFGDMGGYVNTESARAFEGGTTFFIYLLVFLMTVLFYSRLRKNDESFQLNFKLYSLGLFFSLIGQSFDNVFRIAYYFIPFGIPIFTQLMGILSNQDRKRTAICCLAVSIIMAGQYLLLGPGAETNDYKFFWEEPYIGEMTF